MKVKSENEVAQLSPTPSDPMDCSLPDSSVSGIYQARVLEWGAIAFSGYADDITLMAESKEKLKSFLMNVKESEKAGLNLNIQKTKIMASSPITSWQIDGEKNGNSNRLYFLTPKSLRTVIAAMKLRDTCSLEEKLWQTQTAY